MLWADPDRPGQVLGGAMSNRKARRRAAAIRRSARPLSETDKRQLLTRGLLVLAGIIAGALLLGWGLSSTR